MHKVITICNKDYFKYAKLFIETRHRVKAKFYMYGPDLTDQQRELLHKNKIVYIPIPQELFDTKMQTLKFLFLQDSIDNANNEDLITFVDADTFFLKDWNPSVSRWKFDIGITTRNDMMDIGCLRAYANGGVIFIRNTDKSFDFMAIALDTIEAGCNIDLPEYGEIWKTLEDPKRPEHKRHFRTNLRCWTDQVFLSALVYHRLRNSPGTRINDTLSYSYDKYLVWLFNCNHYNRLETNISTKPDKNIYIKHLKQSGRQKLTGKNENLLGA